MVDDSLSVFIHLYRPNGAGTHTGTHDLTDGTKRTNLFAAAAFDTHFLIDIGSVVDDGDGTSGADLLAFMAQATTAGVADHETVQRTFIAGRIQYIDDPVILSGMQQEMHTVFDDVSFLINAAAEHRLRTGNDLRGNIPFLLPVSFQSALHKAAGNGFVYQIFDVLYVAFKIFHTLLPRLYAKKQL